MDRIGGVLVETYRIERLIAEGSMGSVYEARHLRIPKRFAVKFLRIGLEDNAEALQRFRREAEVVATLEHPNIVGLYDYNVDSDGVPYIVLEYLDGETLVARLQREHRLPLDETLRIVRAVGSALMVAHARDVIHRDLKPENIMLCGDVVKVVDFGVAKLRGAPELTAVNTVVGTVPYMAPEQLMGSLSDPRIDQYALATIAYEMLAGEMAFDGAGSVADVARRVLTHSPPFVAGVAQAVNEVIFRGMARAADDRFPSVDAFVSALAAAASAEAPLPESHEGAHDPLPPLTGEATRVTAAARGDGDEPEDPVAPPPDDVPARREPALTPVDGAIGPMNLAIAQQHLAQQQATQQQHLAQQQAQQQHNGAHPRELADLRGPTREDMPIVKGAVTLEMAAVTAPDDVTGEHPPRPAQAPLPALNTLVVERLRPPAAPRPLAEPRVTLKTMNAVAQTGWEAGTVEGTRRAPGLPRARFILIGALLGLVLALAIVFLFLH